MYSFYQKHEYFFAALFVLITQSLSLPYWMDYYPDTDNYTHALRILDFLQSSVWAEMPYMHTNYPYGEILHFTRITDVLWLFSSLPLFLFLSVKEAVFYGGFVFQALMLVLTAFVLIWSLKPIAKPFARLIGLSIFFVQPSITETYIYSKPDHHVLTVLFGCLLIGGVIRYLAEKRSKDLYIAGISAGLGLWTSVEGLLIAYGVLIGLVLLCFAGKEKIKTCAVYFFSFFISSFIFLVINPPYEGFFFPDNGRLSFLLVTVIGLTTVALLFLFQAEERGLLSNFWRKSIAFLLTASFFIGILFLIFPLSVVFQPFFPPIIKEIWADNVIELQSCFRSVTLFFLSCWPCFVSFLVGCVLFKFCSSQQRAYLILTLPPLLIFILFTILSIRYARLATLFTPFPLVLFFAVRLERISFSERKKGIILLLLYLGAAYFLAENYLSVHRVLLHRNTPFLDPIKAYIPKGEGSILADTFLGPEIVWMLDEPVIGSPYHRNVEGIADGVGILHTTNVPDAIEALKKHRVKAILLFLDLPSDPEIFYNLPLRAGYMYIPSDLDNLMVRMVMEKDLPCGMKVETNVPPPLVLYTIDFSKCSETADQKK